MHLHLLKSETTKLSLQFNNDLRVQLWLVLGASILQPRLVA